jgi:hypothetical protein
MFTLRCSILTALLALGLATVAVANVPEAGSVLVYPLFDSTPGSGTVICVTNTFTSTLRCPDDHLEGDVVVHYTYYAGDTCLEFDRYEFLTPGDTLCVIADEHNPEGEIGFLVVMARSPVDNQPLEFNHLVGQAIVVQSGLNFSWSYIPVSFLTWTNASAPCNRNNPDEMPQGDGDGAADFNAIEYQMFPRELAVPTFFQEDMQFGNQLTLMSTGGQDYINEVRFLLYNNIESPFSRTFEFTCWWSGPLSEISGAATRLQGDEEELGHGTQTGWVSIRGRRLKDLAGNTVRDDSGNTVIPPLLGVFMQLVRNTDYAMGDVLYGRDGSIDGLELPRGNQDLDIAP